MNRLRKGALAAGAAAGAALLSACDDGSTSRMWGRLEAEAARKNPPQLWSAAVEGQADAGRPVLVCADAAIRDGFRSIVPTVSGQMCTHGGEAIPTANGSRYTCRVNDATYAVSTGLVGDVKTDFTASSSVHPVAGGGADITRSLHFKRVGPCPAGWKVGDTTNQKGERVSGLS